MHKTNGSSYKLRIYIEDTDANQVVYHANYLKFAERARTNLLQQLGILKSHLSCELKLRFVVSRAEIHYIKPAYLDDELDVTTHVHQVTGSTLTIQQEIARNTTILARVLVKLALINDSARPVRLPKFLHEKLSQLMTRSE